MLLCLFLIEGERIAVESLRSLSLQNAKQLIVGNAYGFGVVLHVAAESRDDLDRALRDFAEVDGVTGVITLAIRTQR
jgi:hypothetical protein